MRHARKGRVSRLFPASSAIVASIVLAASIHAQNVDPSLFRPDCRFDTSAAERALRGVAQDVGAGRYRVVQDWTRGGVTTEIPDDMCPEVVLRVEQPVWGTVYVHRPPAVRWTSFFLPQLENLRNTSGPPTPPYNHEIVDWYGRDLELETHPAHGPLPTREASIWYPRPFRVTTEVTGDRAELRRWNEAIAHRLSAVGLIGPIQAAPTPVPTPAPPPRPGPASVTLTVAPMAPVSIPGTTEIVADVSVSGGDSTAQVVVDVRPLDPAASSIVSLIGPTSVPAAGGRRVARLQTTDPRQAVASGTLNLASLSLTPTFEVTARVAGAPGAAATMRVAVPLSAILLKGTTVDADGNPRDVGAAPRYLESPPIHLASQRDPADPSRFLVLVKGRGFVPDGRLGWLGARADLTVPLSVLERRLAGQPTTPGSTIDVGRIDVLEPAEHEARAKDWVRRFLLTMGFDNGYLGTTVGTLASLPVQYAASSTGASPRYGGGRMHIPMPGERYWNGVSALDGDDTPYTIFLHELGHFVHNSMVDRHIGTISLIDKFRIGGDHTTWRVPSGVRTDWSIEATSFFEAIADYFAYAVFEFVERRWPDIRERSIYFDRGYLDEFSTFDRARGARSVGGWKVEGVQSTFWRELYAPVAAASADGPSRAFGDLLRMADRYKKESWLTRWVPARSVRQWLAMKRAHGPVANLDELAEKYAIEGSGTTRWMSPTGVVTGGTIASVDGRRVDLIGDAFFQDLAVGQTVEVVNGEVLVEIDEWGIHGRRIHAHAGKGTIFHFDAPDRLRVERGQVTVDGRIVLAGGRVTVHPSGTLVRLLVGDTGAVEVAVLEGAARIETPSGSADLAVGELVRASPTGTLGPHRTIDVETALAGLLDGEPGAGKVASPEPPPIAAEPRVTPDPEPRPSRPDVVEHEPRPEVDSPVPRVAGTWRLVTFATDPPAEFLLRFSQTGRTLGGTMERVDADEPTDRIEGRIASDGLVTFRRIRRDAYVQRYEGRLVTSEMGRTTLTGFFDHDGLGLWRWRGTLLR